MTHLARRLPRAAAGVILALFLLANLRGLDSTPPVNQDEAWIAAPGVEFFTSGRFATRLFAGYYASERHYYDFMPLQSILDGAAIKLFGMSLVTVRALSLLLAALTLVFTYLAGRRLLSEWHGVTAMLILGFWPVAATGLPSLLSPATGIPLADLGRVGRYDILVPVFGLASLLACLRAIQGQDRPAPWLTMAGALAALATLSHYYGLVWLIVTGTLVVTTGGWRGLRRLTWPALGFGLTMAPWLWFISRDFTVFIAQKQAQARTYSVDVGSVSSELLRYAPVAAAAARAHLSSLLWIALVCAGMVLLVKSAWRGGLGARMLAVTIAVVLVCFTLAVRPSYRYLGTVWPLLALAASCAVLHPWPPTRRMFARVTMTVLVVAASMQGVVAYRQLAERAAHDSRYSGVCDRIAQHLPPSARLLALQHWWLGVSPRVQDYRSFLVPITRMNPPDSAPPMSFAGAMAMDPMDFILIDPAMADVMRAAGDPSRPIAGPLAVQIRAFLEDSAIVVDAFDDLTYGRFTLYRVTTPGSALTR